MRQLLYVSESLVGDDEQALDQLITQARHNNALDGVTGLLWTDGRRFAQVIEGGEHAVDELIAKIRDDARHANVETVLDSSVDERAFGEWSMARPAADGLGEVYEQRMRRELARIRSGLGAIFAEVIAGDRAAGRP